MKTVIYFINYTLSLIMWLIIGRLLLSFFLKNKENFMLGFFVKFTEPVYRITRKIMPFATERTVPFFSILAIFIIRIMLVLIFSPAQQK